MSVDNLKAGRDLTIEVLFGGGLPQYTLPNIDASKYPQTAPEKDSLVKAKFNLSPQDVFAAPDLPEQERFFHRAGQVTLDVRAAANDPKKRSQLLSTPELILPELANPLTFTSGLSLEASNYNPDFHPKYSEKNEFLLVFFDALSSDDQILLAQEQARKGQYQYAQHFLSKELERNRGLFYGETEVPYKDLSRTEGQELNDDFDINEDIRISQSLDKTVEKQRADKGEIPVSIRKRIEVFRDIILPKLGLDDKLVTKILCDQYKNLSTVDQHWDFPFLGLALEDPQNQAAVMIAAEKRGVRYGGMYIMIDADEEDHRKLKNFQTLVTTTMSPHISSLCDYSDDIAEYLADTKKSKLSKGLFTLAKYSQDLEMLKEWEERVSKLSEAQTSGFTHDFLAPFDRAGWINSPGDIDLIFQLVNHVPYYELDFQFGGPISHPLCYYFIQASPDKDWSLIKDYLDGKVPFNFFLIERYANASPDQKDAWSTENHNFCHRQISSASWNVFNNDSAPGVDSFDNLSEHFSNLDNFELRCVFEMINSADFIQSKEVAQRQSIKFIKYILETGELELVKDFITKNGFFHWQAFMHTYSGKEFPPGFDEFIENRKSSTSKAFRHPELINHIWEDLSKADSSPEFQKDFFTLIDNTCDYVDASAEFFDGNFATHFIGRGKIINFDSQTAITALRQSRYPIIASLGHDYTSILADGGASEAKVEALSFFYHLHPELIDGKKSSSDRKALRECLSLYPAYHQRHDGKMDGFSPIYAEKLKYIHPGSGAQDVERIIDFLDENHDFEKQDIEDFNEAFPGNWSPTAFLLEYLASSVEERSLFTRKFEHFPTLFKTCSKGGEDPGDLSEDIFDFLEKDNLKINPADITKLRKVFPKTAIRSSLLFPYLLLPDSEKDRLIELAKQEKALLISRQEAIVDGQEKVISASVLAVIDRVGIKGLAQGIQKVQAEDIQPVPEAFRTPQKITVKRMSLPVLDKDEKIVTGKILLGPLLESIHAVAENESALPYLGLLVTAELAHTNMGKHNQKDTPSYQALDNYIRWSQINTEAFDLAKHKLACLLSATKIAKPIFDPMIVSIVIHEVLERQAHLRTLFINTVYDIVEQKKTEDDTEIDYAKHLPAILELFREIDDFCDEYPASIKREHLEGAMALSTPEEFTDFLENLSTQLKNIVFKSLKRPMLEAADQRARSEDDSEVTLTIVGSPKNEIDYFYAKDTCVSTYTEEINNPQFIPLRILNDEQTELIGFIWCLEEEHPDLGKTLVLSDIHPNLEIRGTLDPETLYGQIIDTLKTYANSGGYKAIVQTNNKGAQSNDTKLNDYINKTIAGKPTVALATITKFPRNSGYDISECSLIAQF